MMRMMRMMMVVVVVEVNKKVVNRFEQVDDENGE